MVLLCSALTYTSFCSFNSLANWQGCIGDGIRLFTSFSLFCFTSLTNGLMVMKNWYVFGTYTLRYFVVLVYLIRIPLQVLYTSDLECFLEKIYILTWWPKICICEKFCLRSISTFSNIIIALFERFLVVYVISSWQYLSSLSRSCLRVCY